MCSQHLKVISLLCVLTKFYTTPICLMILGSFSPSPQDHKILGLGSGLAANPSQLTVSSWLWYLKKRIEREFLQIWHKCPFGLEDKLIRIWRLKLRLFWPLLNNRFGNLYHRLPHRRLTGQHDEMSNWSVVRIHCDIIMFCKKTKKKCIQHNSSGTVMWLLCGGIQLQRVVIPLGPWILQIFVL